MSLKYLKGIQLTERLSKNFENQQGEQGERGSMGWKTVLEAYQTVTSMHEKDRNWFWK